ncbi:DUF4097 domain-containing protein [Streptomyces brevispora]|uniref:DUF4097 family beta strand repeat-containing protein n=1 Tax=Streptomyces brevispora TaxID=887462 RepID=UPI002E31F8D9|nr:DUF4097 family beta strand repeat-containing protein [Streptomyces brevispora]
MAARTRSLTALGGAALVALVATGCGNTDVADAPVEKKSFAYSGKSLTVNSDSSDLELVPADIKEIQVERQVSGSVPGSNPDLVWKLDGDTLTLKLKCTGISVNCKARYSVKVPRDIALTVGNDNGLIRATGFTTGLRAKTDNGEVRLKDMSGAELDLESDNGRIDGEGISAKSVTARTDNGEVRLNFTAVPDLVEAQSHDGGIRLGLPKAMYKVDTSAEKGDITVDVPQADNSTHVVTASTRNGDITIETAR